MIVMSDSCCQRDIDVQALEAWQRRTLLIVLGINIVTLLLMVAAAFHARSCSLLSGGLDNFGAAVTYDLSLAVVGASQRARSDERRVGNECGGTRRTRWSQRQ